MERLGDHPQGAVPSHALLVPTGSLTTAATVSRFALARCKTAPECHVTALR